ncbi:MAG: hypothetical protein WCI49_00570 [Ferruginibacter sp.]
MYKCILFFFCCLCSCDAGAQFVIQGRIVDDSTGLPVPNSSIYLNRTTFQTRSNVRGEFKLEVAGVNSGELIVCAAGYECFAYNPGFSGAGNKFFTFKLIKKELKKESITFPDIFKKAALHNFMESLLGITAEAAACTIENLESVYFVKGKSENITYAFADTPLIITNKLLGYEIVYDLIEFGDDNFNENYFTAYYWYRDIGNKRQFIKQRQRNYFGSTQHFFHSLIERNLYGQGFSIFRMKQAADTSNLPPYTDYTQVNPNSFEAITPVVFLFIDSISNEYYLKFSREIIVQYDKTPHAVDYLSEQGFVTGLSKKGFTASIRLLAGTVGIDSKGIIAEPLSVNYGGFWIYEKLANQLPLNYQPE